MGLLQILPPDYAEKLRELDKRMTEMNNRFDYGLWQPMFRDQG
jgi:hypothetical protein